MTNPPAVASNPLVASALHMLQLFGSVGADLFDITHTNIEGERTGFRRGQSLAAAVQSMPSLMAAADRRQRNIIVRPRSDSSTLIQLDDLDEGKARLTSPAAFLILETSPANFQSWVAVSDCVPGITARLRKGAGADGRVTSNVSTGHPSATKATHREPASISCGARSRRAGGIAWKRLPPG
jgi:hypothetical protein